MADDSPAVTGVVILTALGASVSFFDGDGSGDPEDAGHDPVFVGFEGGSTTAAKVMAAATGARPAKSASEGGADDAGSDAVLADLAGRLLDAICASLSGSGALDAGVQLSAREPPLVAALDATAQTTAGHSIEVVEPSALPSFPKMHRMARVASVDSAGERLHQSQRGLSFLAGGEATHSTSASTGDAMISQAVALAGELERDIKTNAMRVREWYGWHFPELSKLVVDDVTYCRVVLAVRNRARLSEPGASAEIEAAVGGDAEMRDAIRSAGELSMGTDVSEEDITNIVELAERTIAMYEYSGELKGYLARKMGEVAPNLNALVGSEVGARLISHAGSLVDLAKKPASTVQILGAEKALFRALKTRSNTPKYGLIYDSSFVGEASTKNKGRIARVLASKTALAARVDAFSPDSDHQAGGVLGESMRAQVEARLAQFEGTVGGGDPADGSDDEEAVG